MTIVEYPHGSSGYQELVRLRDLHLRRPIGLQMSESDLVGEESQRHFALVEDGVILGGLVANPTGGGITKLRQMWIDPGLRGQGHGRLLLDEVERRLAADGTTHLVLHARAEATGFYESSGYHVTGDPFTEVGIPHSRMEKKTGVA
ncbi:GNAT family N-acetyltransferase [Luteolibacter flavescens]|uniref:GNAT family N-acetyltransferase n=1 Tax=Luteolibacter flavescens TaxID=1859460 RepID=A0ABT3FQJ4_9BACT|nr:GNAT family N-acetyltransferase [Luteolibacter flavescens]MCW1885843.1 GNAT family N-acetyltransferase [Luteolibacter flavescens]